MEFQNNQDQIPQIKPKVVLNNENSASEHCTDQDSEKAPSCKVSQVILNDENSASEHCTDQDPEKAPSCKASQVILSDENSASEH